MKVLVLNNAAPFSRGGAEELADHLTAQLNATPGVQAELVRLPFQWDPVEGLVEEIVRHRLMRLPNVDRVIALKFPAYLVPHPEKVLWVLHQFRQAYDLGDAGQGLAASGREGELRRIVRAADDRCFAEASAIYVNSPTTQGRMARYNGVTPEVLYPPLNDAHLFTGGEAGDYIFAGGRVAQGKRQHLLIEAMAKLRGRGRLLIAGPAETAAYAEELQALVAKHNLADRVSLALGFHPREQIAAWANGALACAYLPFDEDSLGYVTMEAFAAGKAVVTTSDAGGLLEMVNAETGRVTPPEPHALAQVLADLFDDPQLARSLGREAQAQWRKRDLTWRATVSRLLS